MVAGPTESTTRIVVQVQPGARRAAVVGRHGDGWKLRVTAPPVEGRANEAVAALLAEALGVRSRQVTVVHGLTSRRKQVEIRGLDAADAEQRLDAASKG